MKQDTAELIYGKEVNSPCLVYYVENNSVNKLAVHINDNDEDLLAVEKSPNFLTWMFIDEWRDAKLILPPKEYMDKCKSAFSIIAACETRVPETVKSRISKGIKYLPEVKQYLKEE